MFHPAWSLAVRLTAWYAVGAFAVVLGATSFLYFTLAANFSREEDQFLANEVEVLRSLLRHRPEDEKALRHEMELSWTTRQYVQVHIRILDEQGRTLLETPGMSNLLPPALFGTPQPVAAARPSGSNVRTPTGAPFRVLATVAGRSESPQSLRVIQVGLNLAHEEELLAGYRHQLWITLTLALLACTLGGYQIGRLGMRPIARIVQAAQRIESTTLHERLSAERLPGEVAALAVTFNQMLDRLQDSFSRLSQFSADIAHELRGPVNDLRGELEVTLSKSRSPEEYREILSSCLEECESLSRLIDSLLFIARAEHPETAIEKQPLNLADEVRTVIEFFDAAASEKGIGLSMSAGPDLVLDLDRTLFQRAMSNLIANAIAYTPAGGGVSVVAQPTSTGVRLAVQDTGAGIPYEKLPHVFDRFFRADWSRSSPAAGAGLGLSIVKSVALLHGATVEIASEQGKGTTVTLTFPATQRASTPPCDAADDVNRMRA
jgi:two-component system heavy metal sensor histidine kinase CusS